MKKILLLIVSVVFFGSCKESDADKNAILPESNAKINNVSIIVDESLWAGELGDTIRKKFAAPVDGLPQEEPLFTLNQYPSKIFEGFVRKSRNIVIVQKSDKTGYSHQVNQFAKPQQVFYVFGKSNEDILKILEQKSAEIISKIKAGDIIENQIRLKKSIVSDKKVRNKFGVGLTLGYGYKYDMIEENFLWIRKQFNNGASYNSILVYEVPFETIEKDNNIVNNIVQMRDSIGKEFIHGVLPNTWMITEPAYAPYLFETTVAGKKAYLTKGTWDLKNDFMAGPFVNYAIKDEKNNRYLILEGFTFHPSKSKRDLVFELEAIIQSVKFLK
ncbi:DUF4837 family protein [Flavobacterium sp.]|jgi:hypothetical protein|uniref:DUF4837 family protein n=1 Tax=Flavobacterium sp. TaxID=239 RepID=UPI002A7FEE21|nr:DUF4837 family protein [Flavobacterium sp.]